MKKKETTQKLTDTQKYKVNVNVPCLHFPLHLYGFSTGFAHHLQQFVRFLFSPILKYSDIFPVLLMWIFIKA